MTVFDRWWHIASTISHIGWSHTRFIFYLRLVCVRVFLISRKIAIIYTFYVHRLQIRRRLCCCRRVVCPQKKSDCDEKKNGRRRTKYMRAPMQHYNAHPHPNWLYYVILPSRLVPMQNEKSIDITGNVVRQKAVHLLMTFYEYNSRVHLKWWAQMNASKLFISGFKCVCVSLEPVSIM